MTITIDNNNTITPTMNINVNTNLTENGELSIPITVGLLKFTKTFTYSISLRVCKEFQVLLVKMVKMGIQ